MFASLLCMSLLGASYTSLVVMPLKAEMGVKEGAARVLTESIVDHLRSQRVFERVVTYREIETTLGLEQQKQLMNCTAVSCIAEVTGALGVDYLLMGSVARLGDDFVISARILRAKDAEAVASDTVRQAASNDAILLDAAAQLSQHILAALNAEPAPAVPSPTADVTEPAAQPSGGGPLVPALAAGGTLVAMGVLTAPLVLTLWAGAVAMLLVPIVRHVSTPGLEGYARTAFFPAAFGAGGLVGLVISALGLLLLAGGAALLAMGLRG